MFLPEWREFPSAPCLAEKKTWQLASRCCWNRARRLTCFLSASVTRKDLQFGTWTDPSFQRHYRFRPTTSGSRSGYGLIAPLRIWSYCINSKDTQKGAIDYEIVVFLTAASFPLTLSADCIFLLLSANSAGSRCPSVDAPTRSTREAWGPVTVQDWLVYQSDQWSNLGINSYEAVLLLSDRNASDILWTELNVVLIP